MSPGQMPTPHPEHRPGSPMLLAPADLERDGTTPLYLQLHARLDHIVSRADHGAKLPSEHDVASHFGVSRHVARQALNRLVSEGKVNSRHGAGYFVNRRMLQRSLPALESFTTSMARLGVSVTHRIVTAEAIPATGGLTRLCARQETEVFHIVRISAADNEVVCQLEGFYRLDIGSALDLARVEEHGVYEQLHKRGVHPYRSEALLSLEFADLATSTRLTVPPGAPLYQVDCWTSDRSGREVEFSRELDRTDRFEFAFTATSVPAVELAGP